MSQDFVYLDSSGDVLAVSDVYDAGLDTFGFSLVMPGLYVATRDVSGDLDGAVLRHEAVAGVNGVTQDDIDEAFARDERVGTDAISLSDASSVVTAAFSGSEDAQLLIGRGLVRGYPQDGLAATRLLAAGVIGETSFSQLSVDSVPEWSEFGANVGSPSGFLPVTVDLGASDASDRGIEVGVDNLGLQSGTLYLVSFEYQLAETDGTDPEIELELQHDVYGTQNILSVNATGSYVSALNPADMDSTSKIRIVVPGGDASNINNLATFTLSFTQA